MHALAIFLAWCRYIGLIGSFVRSVQLQTKLYSELSLKVAPCQTQWFEYLGWILQDWLIPQECTPAIARPE